MKFASLVSAGEGNGLLVFACLGHLSNIHAAGLLVSLDGRGLQHIVVAHLSTKNNIPLLAVHALSFVLSCAEGWIGVAG